MSGTPWWAILAAPTVSGFVVWFLTSRSSKRALIAQRAADECRRLDDHNRAEEQRQEDRKERRDQLFIDQKRQAYASLILLHQRLRKAGDSILELSVRNQDPLNTEVREISARITQLGAELLLAQTEVMLLGSEEVIAANQRIARRKGLAARAEYWSDMNLLLAACRADIGASRLTSKIVGAPGNLDDMNEQVDLAPSAGRPQ